MFLNQVDQGRVALVPEAGSREVWFKIGKSEDMTRNIGQFDKIARIVIGALLVVLAAVGTIGIWGYLGTILLMTALINFCPIYRMIGVKT